MSEKKQLQFKLIMGGTDDPAPAPSPPKPMSIPAWMGLYVASLVIWVALFYWMWMSFIHR